MSDTNNRLIHEFLGKGCWHIFEFDRLSGFKAKYKCRFCGSSFYRSRIPAVPDYFTSIEASREFAAKVAEGKPKELGLAIWDLFSTDADGIRFAYSRIARLARRAALISPSDLTTAAMKAAGLKIEENK